MKPHYWLDGRFSGFERWKVRHGAWVLVGFGLMNCHKNYLYWSMQSNEKPS